MPIPDFDHNLVLPPHLGDPRLRSHISPFPCTTIELCEKFATSPERIEILTGYLNFRKRLNDLGLLNGYQWLDGSFLQDIEMQQRRPPNDLDLVTIYWGYDRAFQQNLVVQLPEFSDVHSAKANYKLDHYPFDASADANHTVATSRYWSQLFTHTRDSVWKGMLKVALNTPIDDATALDNLKKIAP